MRKKLFIAGTGTDVGKTLAAAVTAEALQADYWKPIQAGNLKDTDRMYVESLTSASTHTHAETYRLQHPASPHDAAKRDNTTITLNALQLPATADKPLVIEGAGGLMVPLNQQEMVIDLIPRIADEVLLVSANFLGSINHTILSIEALQSRHIPVKGLIFNGERYAEGEDWITNYTGVSCLGRLNPEPAINASVVQRYAATWNLKTTDDSYEPG